MDKPKYIRYLRDQAKLLNWLAEELEQDQPITTDWMIDWELHKEQSLIDAQQVYIAELNNAVETEEME